MKYLGIHNKGEIDINAFKILGASTKREDANKIGKYGSGLKYAIAYLLRENIDFKVFSGLKEIKFKKRTVKLRDQPFEVMVINGKQTGFSIEMGPDWKPWFTIREILSNAIDEGNMIIREETRNKNLLPTEGITSIYIDIENNSLTDVYNNWDSYFAFERTIIIERKIDNETVKLYATNPNDKGVIVYKNGIRVFYDPSKPSVFHYDISDVVINEMREVNDTWSIKEKIASIICNSPIEIIEHFIEKVTNEHFEAFLNFDYNEFNEDWEEILKNSNFISFEYYETFKERTSLDDYKRLPNSLFNRLRTKKLIGGYFGSGSYSWSKPVNVLPVRNFYIDEKIRTILKKIEASGYKITALIVTGVFDDNTNYSTYSKDSNIIYLSEKLEGKTEFEIAKEIIKSNEKLMKKDLLVTTFLTNSGITAPVEQIEDAT